VKAIDSVSRVLGRIPNRLQLAGGWIDQPFVSRHNPTPPGSMVVVQIEPNFRPMDRSGIASGTRAIAEKIWNGRLPRRPLDELVRELYAAENQGKAEPSGSQDMIGLVYPGVNRLDYDYQVEGGVFPAHIESCNSRPVARWLERVLHLLPIEPRPSGYNPIGVKNLAPRWVARLGQSGQRLFRGHPASRHQSAGRFPQSQHEVLGEVVAPHGAASLDHGGLDEIAARVSAPVCRGDVFRLWRRLFDCGFGNARARSA
jgi:hypothetical protein